jgi:hypothetical protein
MQQDEIDKLGDASSHLTDRCSVLSDLCQKSFHHPVPYLLNLDG